MKKKLKKLLIVVGVLLVLVLGFSGYWSWGWSSERKDGENRLAQIRMETSKLDPEWEHTIDHYNSKLDSPDRNSAMKALAVVDSLPREFHQWCNEKDFLKDLNANQTVPDEAMRELKDKLKPYERQIAELKQLIHTSPHSGFPLRVNQQNPMETSLEDRQKFRRVAQLLHFDLLVQLQSQPKSNDLTHTRAILGAARALQDDCLLICQLVRLATVGIAISALERSLAQIEHPTQLEELRKELFEEIHFRYLRVALRGERLIMDQLFENLDRDQLSLVQLSSPNAPPESFGYARLMWMNYRRYMPDQRAEQIKIYTEIITDCELDFPERTQRMNQYSERFKTMTAYNRTLIRLLTPAFDKINDAEQRNQTMLRCAYVATACEEYRLKNKKWPGSLEEIPKSILPSIPIDPYSGEPLKMNRTDTGIVIYSVGKDEFDHEGDVLDQKMGFGTDIGIRLYDLEHRHR